MRTLTVFAATFLFLSAAVCFAGVKGPIQAVPVVSEGITQGDFMDWSCWEGFRPVDDQTDEVDTLWWTGNIEYHILGGESVSWDPDLPEEDGVFLQIKYGLWNSPSVGLAVSVNGNHIGTAMANYGYISPGPKYGRAPISAYIGPGPDLIEIVASYGGEAVIGYVAAGVRVTGGELAGEVEDTFTPETFKFTGPAPNPFNPTTTLSFTLPEACRVRLDVFDISGRLIASPLQDGWRDAGMHNVTFDGSNFASGVYLYRFTAGEHAASGKMILMK